MHTTQTDPAKPLVQQALAHGAIAAILVGSVTLASAWVPSSHGGMGLYAAAAWAFLCGLGLSHIIHEWCHYAGAALARSTIILKPVIHPLFFDFDFPANTPRQFLCLSLGGLVGNFLLLGILVVYAPAHDLVMTSLLAAVLGQLVFVLLLELPVSLEVLAGKDPLQALTDHFGQGGPLFLRAGIGGVVTSALVFLLH